MNVWQGTFPAQNTLRRRLPRHRARSTRSRQRLRPPQHDRQRLGMVRRLVHGSATRDRGPLGAGHARRLLPLPRLLLQPLPGGGPQLQHRGQLDRQHRVSLRPRRESQTSQAARRANRIEQRGDQARRPADPRSALRGPDHLRRQGPRHRLPADRAAAPAGGRAQRPGRPARRRRLRRLERLRRPLRDARPPSAWPANGLKYTRFHTTALCSPTRAALLSGRNHHSVGMGGITEIATSAPGYNSVRPNTAAPLAETLKLNGYSTAQFGKCHEVPVWETSSMGPFDSWPSGGGGFEHFYGFIAGETNQYYPALYEGTTPVEPDRTPEEGYHLTEDLADQAIGWVREQKSLSPDKPFFMYFAPGRDPRAAPRPGGVVGQVQGPLRRGLGRAARGDARAPEGARRRPGGRGADRAARGDPRLGGDARGAASRCWRARWRSTPASWSTPTTTSAA